MKVYILCHRYVDKYSGLDSRRISKVFEDPKEAYSVLTDKIEKGDFSWFVVAKDLQERKSND